MLVCNVFNYLVKNCSEVVKVVVIEKYFGEVVEDFKVYMLSKELIVDN